MVYYSTIERNEVLIFGTTTWMNLENITLSERSQSQKSIYCMIPLVSNVQNRQIHKYISDCHRLGKENGK